MSGPTLDAAHWMRTGMNEWPAHLFGFVVGRTLDIGICGDVLHGAVEEWVAWQVRHHAAMAAVGHPCQCCPAPPARAYTEGDVERLVKAAELQVLNYQRQSLNDERGDSLGDDDHEAWSALDVALAPWRKP